MKDRGDFAQRKLRGIIHIQREAEFGFQPLCAEGEEFAFFPLEQGGFRRLFRGNRFLPVRKGGKGEEEIDVGRREEKEGRREKGEGEMT